MFLLSSRQIQTGSPIFFAFAPKWSFFTMSLFFLSHCPQCSGSKIVFLLSFQILCLNWTCAESSRRCCPIQPEHFISTGSESLLLHSQNSTESHCGGLGGGLCFWEKCWLSWCWVSPRLRCLCGLCPGWGCAEWEVGIWCCKSWGRTPVSQARPGLIREIMIWIQQADFDILINNNKSVCLVKPFNVNIWKGM